jgi:hypothetical protein
LSDILCGSWLFVLSALAKGSHDIKELQTTHFPSAEFSLSLALAGFDVRSEEPGEFTLSAAETFSS